MIQSGSTVAPLSCDLRRVGRPQSVVWRQPVKLDYFRVADNTPRIVACSLTSCTRYNHAHGWRSLLARNSAPMKFTHPWLRVDRERCPAGLGVSFLGGQCSPDRDRGASRKFTVHAPIAHPILPQSETSPSTNGAAAIEPAGLRGRLVWLRDGSEISDSGADRFHRVVRVAVAN